MALRFGRAIPLFAANDEAAKSISVISRTVADAIVEAQQKLKEIKAEKQATEEEEEKTETTAEAE